jgi:hypothetical protein
VKNRLQTLLSFTCNSYRYAALRKKVIKGNWNIAKDKASQQVSMEKVQSYGEVGRCTLTPPDP